MYYHFNPVVMCLIWICCVYVEFNFCHWNIEMIIVWIRVFLNMIIFHLYVINKYFFDYSSHSVHMAKTLAHLCSDSDFSLTSVSRNTLDIKYIWIGICIVFWWCALWHKYFQWLGFYFYYTKSTLQKTKVITVFWEILWTMIALFVLRGPIPNSHQILEKTPKVHKMCQMHCLMVPQAIFTYHTDTLFVYIFQQHEHCIAYIKQQPLYASP